MTEKWPTLEEGTRVIVQPENSEYSTIRGTVKFKTSGNKVSIEKDTGHDFHFDLAEVVEYRPEGGEWTENPHWWGDEIPYDREEHHDD